MILGVTGHRPQHLGSLAFRTRAEVERAIETFAPEMLITGMALGVDTWAAETCVKLAIPFIAAIPFEGQHVVWPAPSQEQYFALRQKAERVVVVCRGGYAPWKFQKRNEFIVDNCHWLLAVCDGEQSGTQRCVDYARVVGRSTTIINPKELT